MMKVAMVMAMDRNRLIGKEGGLPWKISADLKYFKRVTMGKPIIMGRKTWDSIGRPLPGRTNIVVTRNTDWQADGVVVANDIQAALVVAEQHLGDAEECAVIGGAMLCEQAMLYTDRLYLTVVDHEFEGDTWLDSYKAEEWNEISRERLEPGDGTEYALDFLLLERP